MEPVTTTAILSTLGTAGSKAADLGKVFLKDLEKEESRIRLFFKQLLKKPLSWTLTLLFSPLILSYAIFNTIKRIPSGSTIVVKIKLGLQLFGLLVSGLIFWVAGTWLGTIGGIFVVKNIFGYITAMSFLLGTTFSVIFTIIFQIIIFNLVCFFFLKLSKDAVIRSVYEEHCILNNEDNIEEISELSVKNENGTVPFKDGKIANKAKQKIGVQVTRN